MKVERRFWRKFFAPRNSLILLYDHLSEKEFENFQAQIEEVHRYYQPISLSALVNSLGSSRAFGHFSIAFQNARRSVALRAIPYLKEREIPFTLFVRPDCVGTNRLPLSDEIEYFRSRAQAKSPDRFELALRHLWEDEKRGRDYVGQCTENWGPLRIDDLDPTQFFMTWGKILEIPPNRMELGIHIPHRPVSGESLELELSFIRRQTNRPLQYAFSPQGWGAAESWRALGVRGLLSHLTGAVDKNTTPMGLPHWEFEEKEYASEKTNEDKDENKDQKK